MIDFKQFIKIFFFIIEKIGPTVATLFAVYLAYRYAKKQKWFEDKSEEYKKVRKAISNLILIWRELSYIEFYSASDDVMAELIFKDPKIASNYFNIDVKRIKKFEKLFRESKEELKSINVTLFYDLDRSFMEFKKTFKHFDSSSKFKKDEKEDLKHLINGLLKELVRGLEKIMLETANHLPAKEKKEIESIFGKHQKDLSKTDFDYEVPKFLIDWINTLVPLREPITDEDMKLFVSDHTVKAIMNKTFPLFIDVFFRENPMETFRTIKQLITNPNMFEVLITEEDIILKLDISESDNLLLKENKVFYKLICAGIMKFSEHIPFEIKRLMININNGTIDIKKEFEMHKAKVVLKNYTITSKM